MPGYDHPVPLGRKRFRAEALIKLALMGYALMPLRAQIAGKMVSLPETKEGLEA